MFGSKLSPFSPLLPARLLWLCLLSCWIGCVFPEVAKRSVNRSIVIFNDSKAKVQVFWVHPSTKAGHLMTTPDLVPGADFRLDSFVGHQFEVQEMPSSSNGVCSDAPDNTCRKAQFKVSENDQQVIRVSQDFEAVFEDNKIKARKQADSLVADCRAKAARKLQSDDSADVLEELMACVEGGVTETLEKVQEEIAFQASVRTEIAHKLENYTCLDDTLDSSPDIDTVTWKHGDEPVRTVHVKHQRPASRIHVIENFIRPEECVAMEEAAETSLHHATVADGKGGSRLSENRKAMQAGIKVPWQKEQEGDEIARLSRRVYDYTNHVLGLDIKEFGQEDLMSIQYFGRGMNDTEPDRYTPHCDGDCTGLPHKWGTRMATLVMYCHVADRGGHTNFRNSGVHIKPTVGAGIFFSYIDPETLVMDTGFTEHSGCPVFEGEKKIVTQWVRLGVDTENPWDSFNTLGIKKSEMGDQ